jgi:uncharacterized protein YndB with AHSA1/START domain
MCDADLTTMARERRTSSPKSEPGAAMSQSILLAVNVEAPPQRVFKILSTTKGQRSFWTDDCNIEGDRARFGFAEAPMDLTVSVRTVENALVQMKVLEGFPFWETSTWEWELRQDADHEDHTTVIFRHYGFGEGIPENALGGTAQTWAMTLEHLTIFIATGKANPYFGGKSS